MNIYIYTYILTNLICIYIYIYIYQEESPHPPPSQPDCSLPPVAWGGPNNNSLTWAVFAEL